MIAEGNQSSDTTEGNLMWEEDPSCRLDCATSMFQMSDWEIVILKCSDRYISISVRYSQIWNFRSVCICAQTNFCKQHGYNGGEAKANITFQILSIHFSWFLFTRRDQEFMVICQLPLVCNIHSNQRSSKSKEGPALARSSQRQVNCLGISKEVVVDKLLFILFP